MAQMFVVVCVEAASGAGLFERALETRAKKCCGNERLGRCVILGSSTCDFTLITA
jgi:hypothetical protein